MSQPTSPSSRLGQRVADRYEIVQWVATGGQGYVFRAVDHATGGAVAIKMLREEFAADAAWRERMFREARALTTLAGTAAVQVYEQGFSEDQLLCIVMEWLEGVNFEVYLEQLEASGERLSPARLVELLEPIVQTLEAAHANQILHRDIKPANLFVETRGATRLLDFGFAKFTSLVRMTEYGHVAGSPSYIAPECWAGEMESLDQRIDVYGLAAVIFRALAGKPPFVGSMMALYRLATMAPRPSLRAIRSDLPRKVDDWVRTALAIEPRDRFENVSSLWAAFKLVHSL
jgi:eukaryotic-like serine/threonine-protein kinase